MTRGLERFHLWWKRAQRVLGSKTVLCRSTSVLMSNAIPIQTELMYVCLRRTRRHDDLLVELSR